MTTNSAVLPVAKRSWKQYLLNETNLLEESISFENMDNASNIPGHKSEPNHQVNKNNSNNNNVGNSNKDSTKSKDENIGNEETLSIRARVEALRETMTILKEELLEEKALWKKEIEQITNLMNPSERYGDSDTNLLSDLDYDLKPIPSIHMNPSDLIIASPIIRDYEEKITRYQGALAQAQAEKRFNIRRQIAANTYRKRLNEVEKLCQEELAKVKETATYLEPLKQIASEWSMPKNKGNDNVGSPGLDNTRRRVVPNLECGGDFMPIRGRETQTQDEDVFDVPVKQIDASLVMDEDASSEIKGKIVLQIGSLPSEVPTICYSAKFE